jgi:two-component system OmpR family sensor kinase
MQWADIDVAELLERVGKQFHGVAAERGLQCQVDTTGPIMVRGDGHRLTQAIDHLLFNALKVTPRGGLIRMSVAVGSRVVIEISDTGAGISASEQLRLFDAFYRTESSRTLQVPGAGTGLAIVKAVVVAHRGDVEVASSPGQGATFRIGLPPLAVDELRS